MKRNLGSCTWIKVIDLVFWYFKTECGFKIDQKIGNYCPFCSGKIEMKN